MRFAKSKVLMPDADVTMYLDEAIIGKPVSGRAL